MIRKIILGFVVFSFFIWNVFADDVVENSRWTMFNKTTLIALTPEEAAQVRAEEAARLKAWNTASMEPLKWVSSSSNTTTTSSNISSADYKKWIDAAQKNLDAAKAELNAGPPTQETLDKIANAEAALKTYQDAYNSTLAQEKAQEAARDAACESSWDCLDKPSFVINTWLFSTSGEWLKTWEAKSTINGILGTIIQKLMIALWIIALFVMTIWAWYMILFRWEDEYLSKWKNIFIWWITALVVALSSYYLVNLVWYILYK